METLNAQLCIFLNFKKNLFFITSITLRTIHCPCLHLLMNSGYCASIKSGFKVISVLNLEKCKLNKLPCP